MAFDPNPHYMRQIVIRCGQLLNPNEKNITILYEDTVRKIGAPVGYMSTAKIEHDPCFGLVKLVVIALGKKLREARGLIEDNPDLEKIYDETSQEIGFQLQTPQPTSMPNEYPGTPSGVSRFPTPEETGPFGECPQCHEKKLVILPLCQTCEKAEGGKFKTEWRCVACGHDEVSELFLIQAYQKFNIEIPEGFKAKLGIKTVTDQGLK